MSCDAKIRKLAEEESVVIVNLLANEIPIYELNQLDLLKLARTSMGLYIVMYKNYDVHVWNSFIATTLQEAGEFMEKNTYSYYQIYHEGKRLTIKKKSLYVVDE